MTVGIYCIEHIESRKKYIGKSKNIEVRFKQHVYHIKKGTHRNRYLQSAIIKHGLDAFKFYILEDIGCLNEDVARNRELYWMDFYNSYDESFGYNLRRDSSSGMITHESTRLLKSIQTSGRNNPMFGRTHTEDVRMRLANFRKGTKTPKHTRDKMAASRTGSGNGMYGLNQSEKTKQKISSARSSFSFQQYDLEGNLINTWAGIADLKNNGFDTGNIYAACNGARGKKTYKGFVWKKIPKLPRKNSREWKQLLAEGKIEENEEGKYEWSDQ